MTTISKTYKEVYFVKEMGERNPEFTRREDIAFLKTVYGLTQGERELPNNYFSTSTIARASCHARFKKAVPVFINGRVTRDCAYPSNAERSLQKYVEQELVNCVNVESAGTGYRANLDKEDEIKDVIDGE